MAWVIMQSLPGVVSTTSTVALLPDRTTRSTAIEYPPVLRCPPATAITTSRLKVRAVVAGLDGDAFAAVVDQAAAPSEPSQSISTPPPVSPVGQIGTVTTRLSQPRRAVSRPSSVNSAV